MRTYVILTFCLLGIGFTGKTQTYAQDWTHTDCNGNVHSLYADYLDNYQVVLMEFGMGCSTCGVGGQYFQQLRDAYAISHPGQFKFFYMDYWVPNDCIDIATFLTTWSMAPDASFEHCSPDLAYYMTGSPMPGYVIAAGPWHHVYMEVPLFNNSDTALIHATIDQALADMANTRIEENGKSEIRLYPNPATQQVYIDLQQPENITQLMVTDVCGKQVPLSFTQTPQRVITDVSHLSPGIYYVQLVTDERVVTLPVQVGYE